MTIYEVLERLEYSPVGEWVATSTWGYPLTLASHALGMAVVVGLTAVIGLRLLGYPKSLPLAALSGFVPLMIIGMALNTLTGVVLFIGGATAFFYNIAFQIKLAAIVIGLLMVRYLVVHVLNPAARHEIIEVDAGTRALALAATLVWWVSVVLSGRLIAYLGG